MKNIFKVHNYNLKQILSFDITLEQMGLISCIMEKEFEIEGFLKKFGMTILEFKRNLEELNVQKILELNISVNEKEVVWEIRFCANNKNQISFVEKKNDKFDKISEIFYIFDEQLEALKKIGDNDILFSQIFNIRENNIEGLVSKQLDSLQIDNIDDYKEYLNTSSPFLVLLSLGNSVTYKEFQLFYKYYIVNNLDIGMLNFLIEYTINTSIYNNFSHEFFKKILSNWLKNNINDLEKAMSYIEEKSKIKEKGKYIEPEWESSESDKGITINSKEIEKLLKDNNLK